MSWQQAARCVIEPASCWCEPLSHAALLLLVLLLHDGRAFAPSKPQAAAGTHAPALNSRPALLLRAWSCLLASISATKRQYPRYQLA
jgi:hypothetical protein